MRVGLSSLMMLGALSPCMAFRAVGIRPVVARLGSGIDGGVRAEHAGRVFAVHSINSLAGSFHPHLRAPLALRNQESRKLAAASTGSGTKAEYDLEQLRLLDADECIIVNEKDEVLGSGSKKFCHLMENIDAGKALHRAFSVFLFTTDGKLLLQKRSDDKILFPNRWTNTCCSHPLFNDREMDDPATDDAPGVKRAVVRKLDHELGVPLGSVPEEQLHYMTRIVYKAEVGEDNKWGEHEVDYILIAVADPELNLNPNEVSEVLYLPKGDLDGLLQKEEKGEVLLSPWFKLVAQKWLPMWWDAVLDKDIDRCKDVETIHILN